MAVADGESRDLPESLRRLGAWWIIVHAPSLTLAHMVRLIAAEPRPSYWSVIHRCIADRADPRALLDLMTRSGLDADEATERMEKDVFDRFDPRVSWPWFVERPGLLREALGGPDSAARALKILGAMPRLPAGLPTVVADIAVGDSKVNRPLAQAALRSHPRVRELAEQALGEEAGAAGDVPVGAAVLGPDGSLIATAGNRRERDADPTGHAEVLAIRAAAGALGRWRLDDCTCVVTLEPCTMCAGALVAARVGALVFGAFDPKAGAVASLFDVVRDPRLNHRPRVVGGIMAGPCAAVLDEFFAGRRDGGAGLRAGGPRP